MAADQTSLPLPPPDPVTPSEPAPAASPDSAPTPAAAPTGITSLHDKVARAIAAGEAASKTAAAEAEQPAAATSADPVADIPEPPAQQHPGAGEAAKTADPAPDSMSAFAARFELLEKQNAALLEQLAKLTEKPAPKAEPEPDKPQTPPAERTVPDSPYEAQARVYFGELPKPLLTQATEAFERRHGWQMELRAAESALQGGDAAATARVQAAQAALAKVQTALERIDFDAQLAKQTQSPATAPQSWGVVARDEVVDAALADRQSWKAEYQALEDHEVAAVLRAVPAGQSPEDYMQRAQKALDAYVAKKQPAAPAPDPVKAATTPTTQPKNPAPPAPAKPDVTITGDVWKNNEIPTKHEKMQRIIARARGDGMTN